MTHATIAAAGTSLILSTADPLTLGLALIGSQLPDLDTTTSTIGQILFPIAAGFEKHYPHRTITHSLLATGLLTANTSGGAKLAPFPSVTFQDTSQPRTPPVEQS